MSTTNQKITWVVIILLLIGAVYFYMHRDSAVDTTNENGTATSTNATSSDTANGGVKVTPTSDGLSGYANSEYNFTLRYPPNVRPQNFFTTFYTLPSNWRLNAAQANQGKAVVSFPVYRVDQGGVATGKAYPLFYVAELRVGVSPNVKECYTPDAGYTNQKVADVNINGVTFKRFSSSDAAMMKYVQAESYRTVHNNMCYVLEQIKSGSSYRDNTMTAGTSDATLNSYYDVAGNIAKTFKFTK